MNAVSELEMQVALSLVASLDELQGWSQFSWAIRCEHSHIMLVGADDGETFAVIDLNARRVLSEGEFALVNFCCDRSRLRWRVQPSDAARVKA